MNNGQQPSWSEGSWAMTNLDFPSVSVDAEAFQSGTFSPWIPETLKVSVWATKVIWRQCAKGNLTIRLGSPWLIIWLACCSFICSLTDASQPWWHLAFIFMVRISSYPFVWHAGILLYYLHGIPGVWFNRRPLIPSWLRLYSWIN